MNSIRARLLLALILLVAAISMIAASITYRRVLAETSTLFDYQLRQMALSLRSQIASAPRIEVPPEQGDSDFVVQIWDPFGTRVYLSRPGLPMIDQVVLGYTDLSLRGAAWRAYGLQTQAGVIQIAQPAAVRSRLARAAAFRVAVPLLLLLPIMVTCVAWIVGRGLRPLRRVTGEVQNRGATSLRPVAGEDLPDELAPLVSELNRLLSRLDRAFAAQRNFIADAAHELRSPLTALRLQLQLLDRAPDDAARDAARARLGDAIERSIHLVEQLLTLARNEPSERPEEDRWTDLAAASAAATADCHPLAESRAISLSFDAPGTTQVQADPEALRTLARNLIDNAVRYTPAGGTVTVRCRSDRGVLLEVADSGPGIPPEDRARAFDRFHRLGNSGTTGSGLGLAIVKAIADRYGAHLTLTDAADGGLLATVQFPPEPQRTAP